MNIKWIINKLIRYKNREAIIYKEKIYYYSDIINKYNYWKKILKHNNIMESEIIALEGDFTDNYFSLLLALIENNNIILPLSSNEFYNKNQFIKISEIDKIIKLKNNEFYLEEQINKKNNKLLINLINQKKPGLILFSSGSTGEPKGILHNFSKLLNKYIENKKSFRTLLFLLLDHIGGINTVFYTLLNGGTLIISKNKNVKEICRKIEKYKIELLPTTPTFLNILLITEKYKDYDLSSLKLITYGTEVMQEYILNKLSVEFPGIKFKQTYGLSELGILKVKSESSDSVWIKMDNDKFEFKIINDNLYIKSDFAMMGYLNSDNPFDEDGWFNTHDKVLINKEYFKILGRESEIINIGGEKIFPAEIEDIIIQMPGIKDIVVKGEKNPFFGNIVTAKINTNLNDDILELKRKINCFCDGKIKKQLIPVKIEIAKENLFNPRFKKIRT